MLLVRRLSRRTLLQLRALEANVQELATNRRRAFQLLRASRGATTHVAQREFWLEFAWLDQEYRVAVHRLARFCVQHAGIARPDSSDSTVREGSRT
jgi:hypothetical protein